MIVFLASNSRGKSLWVIVNRSEKQSKKNLQKQGKLETIYANYITLSNCRIPFLYIANIFLRFGETIPFDVFRDEKLGYF